MANPEAQKILENLSTLLSDASYGSSSKNQQEAVRLSKALTATIEAPENVAMELAFSVRLALPGRCQAGGMRGMCDVSLIILNEIKTFIPMSARIAVDLNLFEHIVKYEPVNVVKLAELSGAEELLLKRILRPLSSTNFVKEVAEETWGATPVTKAMTQKGIAAGHRMLFATSMLAALHAPRYFLETSHTSPTNPHDGLMQYAHGTKLQSFDYFCTMPGNVIGDFNTFMGNTMGARKYWLDWWPVEERVFEGMKVGNEEENTLLVDVGGGKGHDVMAFKQRFGGRGKGLGRLILQDQPHVLEEIGKGELGEGIEKCGYDFFTEQPVKNSRIYFYHHILHDWSDYKCLEILRVLKSAMKPNYSKLIIHEMIVPESGASTYHALLDLTMMAFNSGIERTGKEWRELLAKAGFEVMGIWVPGDEPDADGIIEAIVRE
ncbi:O-methyltransferase penC [Botrytis cinerea]